MNTWSKFARWNTTKLMSIGFDLLIDFAGAWLRFSFLVIQLWSSIHAFQTSISEQTSNARLMRV